MAKKDSIIFLVLLSAHCSFSYGMECKEADLPRELPSYAYEALGQLFRVINEETPEQIQERVTHLLSIGGDINAIDDGRYGYYTRDQSLLDCVCKTSLVKCKILVEAKADPMRKKDKLCAIPLHRTARAIFDSLPEGTQKPNAQLVEIFKYLVRAGSDAYAEAGRYDEPYTPMSLLKGKVPELEQYVKIYKNQQKQIQKEKKHALKKQKKIEKRESMMAKRNEAMDKYGYAPKETCILQ